MSDKFDFKMSRDGMMKFMQGVLDGFFAPGTGLKWNQKNRKLDDIPTFSIPAGHSCPFAKDCRSCAVNNPNLGLNTGRTVHGKKQKLDDRKFIVQDGPDTKFRCYTAIDEVLKPTVRNARWHNYLLLLAAVAKGREATVALIEKTLPAAGKFGHNPPCRIHVAGDFFSLVYFDAWCEVARRNPGRIFYAYTKALPFWVARRNSIPANLRLTASYGGTHDWMIERYGLRFAKVVMSVEEAAEAKLEIDHDDSHAYGTGGSFALLVHGQQPAGSIAAKAWSALKKLGMGGYGNHKEGTVAGGSKTLAAGSPLPPVSTKHIFSLRKKKAGSPSFHGAKA